MDSDSDGWDSSEQLQIIQVQQQQVFKYRGEKALNLVQQNAYSLQPDMISGWLPKLPSCPLPLTYKNLYVDSLKKYLVANNKQSIVYIGPRISNSVKVNQKYRYSWKYREKYKMNINFIKQAIDSVGNQKQITVQANKQCHQFSSDFESGNLDLVVRVKPNEYDCYIRSDTNTRGHSNWYYFRIGNNQQIGEVRVNICNMTKCKNLYADGMKPYCREGQTGSWTQQPCYSVNFVQRLCRHGLPLKTYQLQFSYNFKKADQWAYFAYCIPYSYSDLENFIGEIKQMKQDNVEIGQFCQSLGGISLPIIIVNKNKYEKRTLKRKVGIITARIHPGQSNSSFLIQGFVRKLLLAYKQKDNPFKNFIFYIIPMMNPDGVIIGNFRTSYSGKDLNRQFNNINHIMFPQIYALQQLYSKIRRSNNEIEIFFDFHGHSSKQNFFCYGPQHYTKSSYYYKSKTLAKFIEKSSQFFSYDKSIFSISEQKKNTARAYMLRKLKIPLSFTFQVSNGIFQSKNQITLLLDKQQILKTGAHILEGLQKYLKVQLNISTRKIKAKVDTGKCQKKASFSMNRNKNIESRTTIIQTQKTSFRQEKTISQNLNKQNTQFNEILCQIKSQQIYRVRNGYDDEKSDYQDEKQDFSKQEACDFYNYMMSKRKIENYKKLSLNQNCNDLIKIQRENQFRREKQNQSMHERKAYSPKNSIHFSRQLKQRRSNIQKCNKAAVVQKHFTLFL